MLDLEALFAGGGGGVYASTADDADPDFPERVLRDTTAADVRTWGASTAFQLVVCYCGEPRAVVWSEGRWSPIQQWRAVGVNGAPEPPGVGMGDLRELMDDLALAAACYFRLDLDEEDHALDLLMSGLADGAHNGLAVGLAYRAIVGDYDDEE